MEAGLPDEEGTRKGRPVGQGALAVLPGVTLSHTWAVCAHPSFRRWALIWRSRRPRPTDQIVPRPAASGSRTQTRPGGESPSLDRRRSATSTESCTEIRRVEKLGHGTRLGTETHTTAVGEVSCSERNILGAPQSGLSRVLQAQSACRIIIAQPVRDSKCCAASIYMSVLLS